MKTTRTIEEAQTQGYVVVRDSLDVSNKFFSWCEKTDAPFVRVRLKTTLAVVEVDLIGNTWKPTEGAGHEVVALLREYQQGSMPGSFAHAKAQFTTYVYAHHIPIDKAEELASKIVAVLREPASRENDGSLSRMR